MRSTLHADAMKPQRPLALNCRAAQCQEGENVTKGHKLVAVRMLGCVAVGSRAQNVYLKGFYRGCIGVIQELYRDNGKQNGNYYLGTPPSSCQ